MRKRLCLLAVFICFIINTNLTFAASPLKWYLPFNSDNRQSSQAVKLTGIGKFGLVRKARPNVPEHLHTGVDFKRPSKNYTDEPVYTAAKGKVISLRDDGPYAQIIIEHLQKDSTLIWTVYEHIAGIECTLGETVDPETPIARYMSKAELDKYGWQFDHFHFEVMKKKPKSRKPDNKRPFMHYGTYWGICYDIEDLNKYYFHPVEFLEQKWQESDL